MREIKFRGFHEYINGKTVITVNGEKKRGEWVYGNLIKMNSSGGQSFIFPYYEFASTLSCRTLISLDMVPVDISTVGQFTGLHDKNGKEIFEGDIVKAICKWDRANMYVEYDDDVATFCLFDNEKVGYKQLCNIHNREVIGNLNENPELMEEINNG